ncbi:hypothetical protein K2173_012104 [Erythroxylum novogranatense]|uniref:Uncharacterized protein n=1 Tax=Erythroxylum novogranatense TaxID=1862640 RepID=A0AAV8TF34_9ROSI|nr:hypothetical protein K2173_012104 [Erythroxylum novogranatense]
MVSEEFSFPRINNTPVPSFVISPSLWRVSSVVYPEYYSDEDEKSSKAVVGDLDVPRKSFSCFQAVAEVTKTECDSSEAKMDMLWEDFNEELIHHGIISSERQSVSSEKPSSVKTIKTKNYTGSDSDQLAKDMERCLVSTRGCNFKRNHRPGQPRRSQSMNGVVKILKKIFPRSDSGRTGK